MSDTAITVEKLSKSYLVGHYSDERERYTALRDVIGRETRSLLRKASDLFRGKAIIQGDEVSEFWALEGITFEVKQGEVLGIIGRNGSGKSTLLKILSRITEPTSGRAKFKGRVASLLEVGTGFHPELSGRENIYLNGTILGMTRREVRRKFDEIVAFAEVEEFVDTPVKRYSSGMYVRLAFAVAAHLESEILLVDEVLAVGDATFQQKCLGTMNELARTGRTVLFVSHNMGAVKTLTERCLHLKKGRIAGLGSTPKIVEGYLLGSSEKDNDADYDINLYRQTYSNDSLVKIRRISIATKNHSADTTPTLEINSDFTIEVELDVSKSVSGAHATIFLKNSKGDTIAVILSIDNERVFSFKPGIHKISAQIKEVPLAPEQYFADVHISKLNQGSYDIISDFPLFRVINNGQVVVWPERAWGVLHCKSVTWEINSLSEWGVTPLDGGVSSDWKS
jgi:lipopolysaccharide transport system ATP-binding protein